MKTFSFLIVSLSVFMLASCSPSPYSKTNKLYKKKAKDFTRNIRKMPSENSVGDGKWVGTTNFSIRKPNLVIIHHTAQNSCAQTLRTFTLERTQVSAHYVICRDGVIHHMLNDYLRAHHAGLAKWGQDTDLNSSSIGIELDNNGYEEFAPQQIESLHRLLDTLKRRYNIPAANFIGHGDIAPTRKNDPNWRFPWKSLADKGFGYWYSDTTSLVVPESFSHLQALRLIGFDTRDSSAAILAFKRHWLKDTVPGITEPARKVLFALYGKY